MFKVSETLEKRHTRFRRYLKSDPGVVVIIAAAEFEWTVRRGIIAMGSSPNATIRRTLLLRHGLSAYKEVWRDEVRPQHGKSLPEIVPEWDRLVSEAFKLRHCLIHGAKRTVDVPFAEKQMERILAATRSVVDFGKERGINVLGVRLPVRRRQPKRS